MSAASLAARGLITRFTQTKRMLFIWPPPQKNSSLHFLKRGFRNILVLTRSCRRLCWRGEKGVPHLSPRSNTTTNKTKGGTRDFCPEIEARAIYSSPPPLFSLSEGLSTLCTQILSHIFVSDLNRFGYAHLLVGVAPFYGRVCMSIRLMHSSHNCEAFLMDAHPPLWPFPSFPSSLE